MDSKKCFICQDEKPITEFNKHSTTKDKLYPYCKRCDNFKRSEWDKNNREKRNRNLREKRAKDISFRLPHNLRVRLRKALLDKLLTKLQKLKSCGEFFRRIQKLHRSSDDPPKCLGRTSIWIMFDLYHHSI